MRLIAAVLLTALTSALAGTAAAETPVLKVYTYESFTADWGPGPQVKKAFEAECGCTVEFTSVEDGVALLSRLKLEGKSSQADVVLGFDTNLTAEATATGLFAPHGQKLDGLSLPVAWTDPVFVPFDWSYFAFVYDKTKVPNPPKSLHDLVENSDLELTIQDPRTSTPGLGLLLWVKQVYGDKAPEAWAKLKPRILTVTPGWSESYGLFRKGEVPMTFSYITSPPYHVIAENDSNVGAAVFSEGNYLQVEVAAKLASSQHPELADRFLAFMLTPAFQDLLPTTQWMYPAVTPKGGLPDAYKALPTPVKALLYPPQEVAANRAAWIAEWLQATSR
jgi:thiamine transport system substrate-binding protein